MKPEPKHFTKEEPCTKIDLWNCFRGHRSFIRKQVDEAHALVGINAPRNMLKNGYATKAESRNAEYYKLTKAGEEWLDKGTIAFLKNHPNKVKYVNNPPRSA